MGSSPTCYVWNILKILDKPLPIVYNANVQERKNMNEMDYYLAILLCIGSIGVVCATVEMILALYDFWSEQ